MLFKKKQYTVNTFKYTLHNILLLILFIIYNCSILFLRILLFYVIIVYIHIAYYYFYTLHISFLIFFLFDKIFQTTVKFVKY